MKIITGKQSGPRKILLWGQHGIGKSTWASEAPSPIFLDIEGGLNDINCARTERIASYQSLCEAITLLAGDPGFHTLVMDTVDWAERLIFNQVADAAGKPTIADIGYGKGYAEAARLWERVLNSFDAAIAAGKGVILLGHGRIVRFENPETQAYDRYEPDLHKSTSGMVQEWCDEVLFASFRVFTRVEDLGFNTKRTIALGGKERFVRTNESAAAAAKNRLSLPDELPMSWAAYAQYLGGHNVPQVSELGAVRPIPPALNELADFLGDSLQPKAGNIAGMVVDGHSKQPAAA